MLNPLATYPANTNPATPERPFGNGKNSTAPGAKNGSPWEKLYVDDLYGFDAALIKAANLTPTNVPDEVGASQRVDAINFLLSANDKRQWPVVSNDAGDLNHDILFSAGRIPSNDGLIILVLPSPLIKQIDASFVAGDALGGLFTGSVAADTTYHLFLIFKQDPTTLVVTVDAGFDTDVNAANIPIGWTSFRRIGSVITDGGSNILGFTQNGDYFELKSRIVDLNIAAGSTVGTTLAVSAPNAITNGLMGKFTATLLSNIATNLIMRSTGSDNTSPSNSDADIITTATVEIGTTNVIVPIDSSGDIFYRNTTVGAGAVRMAIDGWFDERAA